MSKLNRVFNKSKLSKNEIEQGREKRQRIISDAQSMQRLAKNPDFKRFCELLEIDKQGLIATLLSEELNTLRTAEQKIRLIARINQIDRIFKKTGSLIWQMEQMTEVRDAIKDKTHERQALKNKTGG